LSKKAFPVRTEAHSFLWDKGLVSYVDAHGRPPDSTLLQSVAHARNASAPTDAGGHFVA